MICRSTFLGSAGVAFAMVFVPLASLAFIAYGLRECLDHCETPWDLYDAWLLAGVYAGTIAVAFGFGAGAAFPRVKRYVGTPLALALVTLAAGIAAAPAVWVAPRLYIEIQSARSSAPR
jgi:hypothetical protein